MSRRASRRYHCEGCEAYVADQRLKWLQANTQPHVQAHQRSDFQLRCGKPFSEGCPNLWIFNETGEAKFVCTLRLNTASWRGLSANDSRTLSVSRPMLLVILKAWATERM